MMRWSDPGDQNDSGGRIKRRGKPAAKFADQPTLFGGPTPAPANSGPSTKRFDPSTSRVAAVKAAEDLTEKQDAVRKLFLRFGAMNDEQLIDRYRAIQKEDEAKAFPQSLPQQTDSGIRSRRAELVDLNYLRPTGEKRLMRTGGEGKVHNVVPKF